MIGARDHGFHKNIDIPKIGFQFGRGEKRFGRGEKILASIYYYSVDVNLTKISDPG